MKGMERERERERDGKTLRSCRHVHRELRDRAWVVVDPTINPSQMEMYSGKKVSLRQYLTCKVMTRPFLCCV